MPPAALHPVAARTALAPSPGTVFEFGCRGQAIRFHFSDPSNYIPRQIIASGGFFEQAMLEDMREHLALHAPPGACIIDAGANIGNHTLFLAAVCARRVVAVEPLPVVMADLERTCALNGVGHLVSARSVALGDQAGWGVFESPEPGEPGTTRVLVLDDPEDAPGAPEIATLDSLDLPGVPAILKIDVEGSEIAVLSGGRSTLAAHRPVIYAECHGRAQFEAVRDYLAEPAIGAYTPVARFNDDPTYKFMPTVTDPERSRALVALGALAWFGKFQRIGDLEAAKVRHDEIVSTVADLTAQVRRLQGEVARLRTPR